MTNINTGPDVRRIIFKRQQCMYKGEQQYIKKIVDPKCPRTQTHGMSLVIFKIL